MELLDKETMGFLYFILVLVGFIVVTGIVMAIVEIGKMAQRNVQLRCALDEAIGIISHEVDMGRYPYMLSTDNGGNGLERLEGVLNSNDVR